MLDRQNAVLAGIDAFRADQANGLSRTEALRLIVEDWLISHGYMRPGPSFQVFLGGLAASTAIAAANDPDTIRGSTP